MFGRKERDSAWRSRFPDRATCIRCLEEKDLDGMDRLLWCEECREAARARAAVWGWGAGIVLATLLALWIWLYIQPSDLVIGGWIATVVAAGLKGKSGIGVGNIIGADILNICWVAGLSATVNPLTAPHRFLMTSFVCLLIVVGSMLIMLRIGYRLVRFNGWILISLYIAYLIAILTLVPSSQVPIEAP